MPQNAAFCYRCREISGLAEALLRIPALALPSPTHWVEVSWREGIRFAPPVDHPAVGRRRNRCVPPQLRGPQLSPQTRRATHLTDGLGLGDLS